MKCGLRETSKRGACLVRDMKKAVLPASKAAKCFPDPSGKEFRLNKAVRLRFDHFGHSREKVLCRKLPN